MHHQHSIGFMVAVFAFFAVGSGINVWGRAAHSVNSSLNGITSYSQYFKINGQVMASKVFFSLCVLLIWLYHQSSTVGVIDLVWPGGTVPQWLQGILVVTPATAGCFGLFFDVLEDLAVVYLRKKWPNIIPEVHPTFQSVVAKELSAPVAKP